MSEFVYYLLTVLSQTSVDKAIELGMNPDAYNFKTLTDPRREGKYMLLVVNRADGYILNSMLVDSVPISTLEIGAPVHLIP
jgi:hypothetical protein